MRLEVVVGDATEVEGAEALVLPANKQLTLGWGSHLAEKVMKLAGREVEAEALASHPEGIELGQAILTGAGGLAPRFRHLIHAAVLDKYDFNPLFLLRLRERTSEATLRGACADSLRLAHEAGLASVVLTAMGAGIGGMRLAKCARILVEEVRAFAAAQPESALERVIFACYRERQARVFRTAIGA